MKRRILLQEVKQTENESFQILAVLAACLASFSIGLAFVWTSPSIPKIVADKVNYDINHEEASYFTVIQPLGAALSSYFISRALDIVGRKYMLWSMAIPCIISWALTAIANSIYIFYLARFIAGIGDAIVLSTLPVYVAEITTPKVRGTWGNAITFFIYLGQTLINVIGSYTTIKVAAYICVSVPVMFAGTFLFMPETPYFYLMKNRIEDARKSLQRLRGKDDVEEELKTLHGDVQRQMSESGTWKDLFGIKTNRKAVIAGTILRVSQQLSGISCFLVYSQYIFAKAGGHLSASTSAIIFSGLCCGFNFTAAFTLDRFGRRKSYFYSCVICAVILAVESAYFFVEQFHPDVDISYLSWLPITGMILYIIVFSFGLGIIPTLMLGELFSSSVKAKGLCMMNIVFAVLISTTTKLFHVLDDKVGLFSPFLVFGISCVISAVLSPYFVPETSGKTLEEIQISLKDDKNESRDITK